MNENCAIKDEEKDEKKNLFNFTASSLKRVGCHERNEQKLLDGY